MKFSNGSKGDPHGIITKSESINGNLKKTWSVNVTTDNVLSYICRTHLLESNQLMCVSHDVKVIAGQKPNFTNGSSPAHLVFDFKQSRAEIHCEAWGIPQPEISWWRGGLEYEDDTGNPYPEYDADTKFTNNITKSTLVIVNVGRVIPTDITQEFTCNATNIKGTALQNFQFRVENRSTWRVWGPVLGVCTTMLVSTLIFYLYKYWNKSKEQEKFIQDIDIFKFGRQDLLRLHETVADLENTVGSGRDLALILPYQKQYEIHEADLFIGKKVDNSFQSLYYIKLLL
ncbi:unnamed protein product [Allacma fusca]|uniref:Ig-like domain-containing protein n=1 Tax=Allacma fusca TaxID=39272 RepID=A0A8J2K6N0_9HEXA|nr:unnamed protein product [Allacma fusca]